MRSVKSCKVKQNDFILNQNCFYKDDQIFVKTKYGEVYKVIKNNKTDYFNQYLNDVSNKTRQEVEKHIKLQNQFFYIEEIIEEKNFKDVDEARQYLYKLKQEVFNKKDYAPGEQYFTISTSYNNETGLHTITKIKKTIIYYKKLEKLNDDDIKSEEKVFKR